MLDRAAHRRLDPTWLRGQLDDPSTRILAVWRDRSLVTDDRPPRPQLVLAREARDWLPDAPIFLGVEGDAARFAVDLSGIEEADLPVGPFRDLRTAGVAMTSDDFELLAYARGMCRWNRATIHCSRCGAGPLRSVDAGFARVCPHCEEKSFPRTDPAVMVLIRNNDHVLLARQPIFPPGMYSTIAGFVEPGETLEQCVHRECLEEVGLEVENVVYARSQAWPFPSSLMLGFVCRSRTVELRIDRTELEDARWFSMDELASPTGFSYPPPMSLAHHLIRSVLPST